jgi:hypothetical protein
MEAVDDAIAPIEAAPEQYPVIHGRGEGRAAPGNRGPEVVNSRKVRSCA